MIPYGKMFYSGEVILVYIDNDPAFFARVEGVEADKKKGWWQISFLILAIPLKKMTWTLDDEQMRGQEFTMNGVPMQIKRVEAPEEEYFNKTKDKEDQEKKKQGKDNGGNVISMFDEE